MVNVLKLQLQCPLSNVKPLLQVQRNPENDFNQLNQKMDEKDLLNSQQMELLIKYDEDSQHTLSKCQKDCEVPFYTTFDM